MVGNEAIIEITGLINPCQQLDNFQTGLTKAVLDKDAKPKVVVSENGDHAVTWRLLYYVKIPTG